MNPRIMKLSRLLSFLASAFLFLIPLLVFGLWLFGSEQTLLSRIPQYWFIPAGILFEPGTLDAPTRFSSALISFVANIPLLIALWHLRVLLNLYKRLDVFQVEAASRMKKFSFSIVVFALLQPIAGGALSLVTSMNNIVSHQVLSVSIADTDLATIFFGFTMVTIAYVLEEAHRIAEDNKSFV